MEDPKMQDLPGFDTLKLMHWGRFWYIVDCTDETRNPFHCAIGGYHTRKRDAVTYASEHYVGQYT